MTKTNGFWKRLGALLLALSLVVSMCPVKASAAETDTATPLQLTLQRVDRKHAYENPDFWSSHRDILGDFPQSEPSNLVTEQYLYYVQVPDVASEINIYWTADVNTATSESDRFPNEEDLITIENNVATASFTTPTAGAGGVWVKLAGMTLYTNFQNTDAPYEITTAVWASNTYVNEIRQENLWRYNKGNETFTRNFYYGIPMTLISEPDGNSGVDGANIRAENEPNDSFTQHSDGRMLPCKEGSFTLIRKIYYGDLRQKQELTGNIIYPDYNATFEITGGNKNTVNGMDYYSEAPNVTITVTDAQDSVLMPPVTGATETQKWTMDTDGVWTWKGIVNGKTVQFGNETSETINVDTTVPVISDAVAYLVGENAATVKFKVSAASGVQSATVGGTAATAVDGVYTVTGLNLAAGNTANIEVTSNAGHTANASVTVAEILAFEDTKNGFDFVKDAEGNEMKDSSGNYYVYKTGTAEPSLRITLVGAYQEGKGIPTVNMSGWTSTVDDSNNWYQLYNFGNDELTVPYLSATDSENRNAERTATTYKLDSQAPVMSVSNTGPLETTEDTTVTVTVRDNIPLPSSLADQHVTFWVKDAAGNDVESEQDQDPNTAGVQIRFKKTSDDGTAYTASYTVTNGQVLTGINRTSVSDSANLPSNIVEMSDMHILVDKEAPVINVSFDENVVKGLYEYDGKLFAVLNTPVTDDEQATDADDVTVTLSYTRTDFVGLKDADGNVIVGENGKAVTADSGVAATMNVHKHGTEGAQIKIPAKDALGTNAENLKVAIHNGNGTDNTFTLHYNPETGCFEGMLYADRRLPGYDGASEVPYVYFDAKSVGNAEVDGKNKDLYKGTDIKFTVEVTDASGNADANSGIAGISWAVTSGAENYLSFEQQSFTPDANDALAGTYTFLLKDSGSHESGNVTLSATVSDKAGNNFTYEYNFAHDNCAPRVTVTKDQKDDVNLDGIQYSNGLTYTVQIEDAFWDEVATSVTLDKADIAKKGNIYEIKLTGDMHRSALNIRVADKAGHAIPTVEYANGAENDFELDAVTGKISNTNTVVLDTAAPEVTVKRKDAPERTVDSVDYHNTDVTYEFIITDENLSNVKQAQPNITISYKLDGEDNAREVSLRAAENTQDFGVFRTTDGKTYKYEFTLTNGQTMTAMNIAVVDNAGNSFKLSDASDKIIDVETGTYNGNKVVVDQTLPTVTVTRDKDPFEDINKTGIYYKEVTTYTVTADDVNFDTNSSISVEGTVGQTESIPFENKDGKWIAKYTVKNGEKLDNIIINVLDYATNKPEGIEAKDIQQFKAVTDSTAYEWVEGSKPVIVDMTAPTATLTVNILDDEDKTVKAEYVTLTKDGKTYYHLKLDRNQQDSVDKLQGKTPSTIKVQAVLRVDDRNLLANNLIDHTKTGTWKLFGEINDEMGYAEFCTKEIEVPYDDTQYIELNLDVKDAVGHFISDVTVTSIGNTTTNPFEMKDENIKSTILLDRRRPTTDQAQAEPEIKLEMPAGVATVKGVNLYNAVPEFNLTVTDGKDENDYTQAGLKKVSVNLDVDKDAPYRGNYITMDNFDESHDEAGHYKYSKKISFTDNGGECNSYILTVTAVDFVDNEITKHFTFAVDTMAPSVKVEYNPEATVLNELYFNKDRIATITVEDINFSDALTKIETQVDPSDWAHSDDNKIHTATCVYNTDGDYTFDMSSRDLAGNETGDDLVKYEGSAPKKFTVDKTNPVITVSFSPKHTNEFGGLWYYADLTNATVTIDEHNFRAADVAPVFRLAGNVINYVKLGDFTSTGDTHHANAAFSDGNDYDFTITYSDLAGNPAIPYNTDPHFSVDSKDPKIAMSRGDMTADGVNVVSGDIDLQFRITDEEKNLAGYTVKLTHLNNEFETYVITEKDNYRDWFSVDKQDDENTIYVTMANLPKEKDYDGIYTIEITGIDHAGNKTVMDAITYSVNRFGSTFQVDDAYTAQFLKLGADGITYHNSVDSKLIVKEINPNEVFHTVDGKTVRGSMLTVVANGVSRQLVEGKDYTMTVVPDHKETGDKVETWYTYTYEIDPSVFQDENGFISGRYAILFYSEDAAGNKNTNEANISSTVQENANGEYTGKMEFVLDTMPPVITTTGIESNKVYNAEFQRMEILISDTTPTGIQVFLNGTEVALSDAALADTAAWLVLDELTGVYTLNVPEQNELFGSQYVSVIAKDAAGNAAEALVEDFNVSTSLLVRLVHNGWIIVGGGLGIAALIFLLIQWKKKKV